MNSTGIVPFEALSTVSIIYLRSFTYSASQTSAMESRVKLPSSKRLINFSIAFLSNSLSSSSVFTPPIPILSSLSKIMESFSLSASSKPA